MGLDHGHAGRREALLELPHLRRWNDVRLPVGRASPARFGCLDIHEASSPPRASTAAITAATPLRHPPPLPPPSRDRTRPLNCMPECPAATTTSSSSSWRSTSCCTLIRCQKAPPEQSSTGEHPVTIPLDAQVSALYMWTIPMSMCRRKTAPKHPAFAPHAPPPPPPPPPPPTHPPIVGSTTAYAGTPCHTCLTGEM